MLVAEVKTINKNQLKAICNVAKKMNLEISYNTYYSEYTPITKIQVFSVSKKDSECPSWAIAEYIPVEEAQGLSYNQLVEFVRTQKLQNKKVSENYSNLWRLMV